MHEIAPPRATPEELRKTRHAAGKRRKVASKWRRKPISSRPPIGAVKRDQPNLWRISSRTRPAGPAIDAAIFFHSLPICAERRTRFLAASRPREGVSLRLRFSAWHEHRHTLEEKSAAIPVTRERIRQLRGEGAAPLTHQPTPEAEFVHRPIRTLQKPLKHLASRRGGGV